MILVAALHSFRASVAIPMDLAAIEHKKKGRQRVCCWQRSPSHEAIGMGHIAASAVP